MDKEIKKHMITAILVRNGNVNPTSVDYIDGVFDSKIEKLQQRIKKLRSEKKAALNNYVRSKLQEYSS